MATGRVAANAMSEGIAAPVLSTAEDGASSALSVAALLIPIVAALLLIALVAIGVIYATKHHVVSGNTATSSSSAGARALLLWRYDSGPQQSLLIPGLALTRSWLGPGPIRFLGTD